MNYQKLVHWHVGLYKKNKRYLEATVDTVWLSSVQHNGKFLWNVKYEVTFLDSKDKLLGTNTFFFTEPGSESDLLEGGKVYRRYARHNYPGANKVKGGYIYYSCGHMGTLFCPKRLPPGISYEPGMYEPNHYKDLSVPAIKMRGRSYKSKGISISDLEVMQTKQGRRNFKKALEDLKRKGKGATYEIPPSF
ncbi:MAG: hypothetical protein AMJ94_06235 [Deltaproteobacteria bacterium SM23_61]|nr:MAG: hypothetical protein AMJ94_06235 [Deltaproteobacteria bacterium SM23_61]